MNRARRGLGCAVALVLTATAVGACGDDSAEVPQAADAVDAATHADADATASPAQLVTSRHHDRHADDVTAAMLANAAFQDVEVAEAAGYASSLATLGCFMDTELGGMGVHYIDESLLDAELDVQHPEALVYELDASGEVVGLVAHEYIVPVDAWTSNRAPRLFGMKLHRHPLLPLWVMHAWLWKDNPAGTFVDWNPAVRPCPEGVPVFGVDLP
jgi:hypothetical protein